MYPIVAFDTETTGNALYHGCSVFAISACAEDWTWFCQWPVDPKTRIPRPKKKDLREFKRILANAHSIVAHNILFDAEALLPLGIDVLNHHDWHDTMLMSHVLDNRGPHGLKELATKHLLALPEEEAKLKEAVNVARREARHQGIPIGPESAWDYWLPSYLDPSSTLLRDYAVGDVERTLALFTLFMDRMASEGQSFVKCYHRRLRQVPIIAKMQRYGVGFRKQSAVKLLSTFDQSKAEATTAVQAALRRPDLNIRSGKQLQEAFFSDSGLKLPVYRTTAARDKPENQDKPIHQFASLDETALVEMLHLAKKKGNLRAESAASNLLSYRKADTAAKYLEGYIARAIRETPRWNSRTDVAEWRLHPSYLQTGTDVTRWSSRDPNMQNVTEGQTDEDGHRNFPLRSAFGPSKDRLWVTIDYSQLHLRIFAVCCGDKNLIAFLEEGADIHSSVASEIFGKPPHKITKEERRVAKAVNFGIIYGAGKAKINATAGMPDAYERFAVQFPAVTDYIDKVTCMVRRNGFIETKGGYRLFVDRNMPYKGVNYIVQGTEGDIVQAAIVSCDRYLTNSWFDGRISPEPFITMQVHDELVFDLPTSTKLKIVIPRLQRLMEREGKSLGIYTPTDAAICRHQWDVKEKTNV